MELQPLASQEDVSDEYSDAEVHVRVQEQESPPRDRVSRLPSRSEMKQKLKHVVFAPVVHRDNRLQRSFRRSVWWLVWLFVLVTFVMVSAMYNYRPLRQMLAGNIVLWCVVLVLWIAFASVSFFSWIDLWSLGGQVTFVVCAVLLHSLILTWMISIVFHGVGLYAVVFFFYLLSIHCVFTLRPCGGADVSSSSILVTIASVVLVAMLIVPLHWLDERGQLQESMFKWVAYPYAEQIYWLQPPTPIWQAYTGAVLGMFQMFWCLSSYRSLIKVHEASQTWFFVGRVYLVVIFGWQMAW